jgi:dUTP pyrophosphatase
MGSRTYLERNGEIKMKIMLDKGAYMPIRGHKDDAGLDLRTPVAFSILPGGSAKIDTGVHIDIRPGLVGMLKSKSGLNVKHGITSEGVIDAGYTGSIVVKLYNHGTDAVAFSAGDKITQLVLLPVYIPDELVVVDGFEQTDRGSNGFGSTGA